MGCTSSTYKYGVDIIEHEGVYYVHMDGMYCSEHKDVTEALVSMSYARSHSIKDWKPLKFSRNI